MYKEQSIGKAHDAGVASVWMVSENIYLERSQFTKANRWSQFTWSPVDIRRHISCEQCDSSVTGGYDPETNQVVICQNNVGRHHVQGILTHEMIHMFDYCTNNLDFKNIEHLACTEIRAANLAHCSFLSAYAQVDADFFNIKKKHQECVKSKAYHSILAVRNISKEEAVSVIEKVFPKCYNDMEPIGRRIRRNSADIDRAYEEGKLFGYTWNNSILMLLKFAV